jgi:hypothetical protein
MYESQHFRKSWRLGDKNIGAISLSSVTQDEKQVVRAAMVTINAQMRLGAPAGGSHRSGGIEQNPDLQKPAPTVYLFVAIKEATEPAAIRHGIYLDAFCQIFVCAWEPGISSWRREQIVKTCFENLRHQALEANWSQRACYNADLDMAVYVENFNTILRGGQRGSFLRFLDGNRKVGRFSFYASNRPDAPLGAHRLEDGNWDGEEEEEEEGDSDSNGDSMVGWLSDTAWIPSKGRFRAPGLERGY